MRNVKEIQNPDRWLTELWPQHGYRLVTCQADRWLTVVGGTCRSFVPRIISFRFLCGDKIICFAHGLARKLASHFCLQDKEALWCFTNAVCIDAQNLIRMNCESADKAELLTKHTKWCEALSSRGHHLKIIRSSHNRGEPLGTPCFRNQIASKWRNLDSKHDDFRRRF